MDESNSFAAVDGSITAAGDHRFKWLTETIRALFQITDGTCCAQFLAEHQLQLRNYFDHDDGNAGDLTNQLLVIWQSFRDEIVNELITVLEPGAEPMLFLTKPK